MRFGLLGTGPWAERTHALALAAHPHAELAGVWGRRPEAAAALAERHGTRAHTDVDDLFADCDAVAVALPPDVQAGLAVRAAAAGKHLLLDKPLATTVPGARQVADAVRRAGVRSVVFFTLRFAPTSARWIAEQRVTGDWFTGRADWYSPVFGGADSPYTASPWRREKGALWDVGPHALSVLTAVLGDVDPDDPDAVTAARGPGDTVHLALRHTGGASSTVTVTHSVPPAAAGVVAELRGTSGVVCLPEREEPAPVAFAAAVDALLAEEPHPCDAAYALRVTEILAAAEARLR
ncbi:Gfo/Idh/MocA family oxidoreductase [Streptomyces chumphonensis]|uniref:Gfo/Idh/MocA family oxidoreductase n=1 Tax=Streptomyces chumphonensis TaxID=1214925 RepID=A0A927EW25_9ACTN|nr:Gfo/Idh/MocA family oxidoreductase [Streptomyces chumphonensis]MBD3930395.1 Gfo/Idh/MocA family oxidoreductase [Streptomyces chumphonensis]